MANLIQFHLGSKSHVVNYPINNELDQSFIGIVKNNKENNESWVTEGSIENLLLELNTDTDSHYFEHHLFTWEVNRVWAIV